MFINIYNILFNNFKNSSIKNIKTNYNTTFHCYKLYASL